jgi:hypothetical protein
MKRISTILAVTLMLLITMALSASAFFLLSYSTYGQFFQPDINRTDACVKYCEVKDLSYNSIQLSGIFWNWNCVCEDCKGFIKDLSICELKSFQVRK